MKLMFVLGPYITGFIHWSTASQVTVMTQMMDS